MIKNLKRWWGKLRREPKNEPAGEMELNYDSAQELWQTAFDKAVGCMWVNETIPTESTMQLMQAAASHWANLALDAHETRFPS